MRSALGNPDSYSAPEKDKELRGFMALPGYADKPEKEMS
jgi:hypothetical protein